MRYGMIGLIGLAFSIPIICNAETQIDWLSFRVSQMTALYYHQVSLSGGAFWVPRIYQNGRFDFRVQLGTHLMKANSPELILFFAPEVQGLIGYRIFDPIELEIGTGLQYWAVIDGTARSVYSIQAHYVFTEKILGCIQTVFIGSTAMIDYGIFPQYRLGVQIGF